MTRVGRRQKRKRQSTPFGDLLLEWIRKEFGEATAIGPRCEQLAPIVNEVLRRDYPDADERKLTFGGTWLMQIVNYGGTPKPEVVKALHEVMGKHAKPLATMYQLAGYPQAGLEDFKDISPVVLAELTQLTKPEQEDILDIIGVVRKMRQTDLDQTKRSPDDQNTHSDLLGERGHAAEKENIKREGNRTE